MGESQRWLIRRDQEQYAAPDLRTLKAWAKSGRVVSDDCIYHPTLNQWVYASKLQELQGIVDGASSTRQVVLIVLALILSPVLLAAILGGVPMVLLFYANMFGLGS